MRAALAIEWLKFRRAPIVAITSVLMVAGVVGIGAAALYGAATGNAEVIAKTGASADWSGLLGTATQIVSVAGLLAFGTVVGWTFGREFTDGAVVSLFAQAVSRRSMAVAKLVILTCWGIALSVAVTVAVMVTGLAAGFGAPPVGELARLLVVGVLTVLLVAPCGWVATARRGYLPAIGTVIGIVVVSQVVVLGGGGAWFPFSAPGLWGAGAASTPVVGLLLVPVVYALAVVLTTRSWTRLTL